VYLDVHAAGHASRVFHQQKSAFLEIGAHTVGIDAVAVEDGAFHDERRIDEVNESVNVARAGKSRSQRGDPGAFQP
jgi:hypothetical protein